ncbi:MAG: 2-hydroxychromene-2-carboxylate isomerase [Pseudomonadota bacterium]
MDRKIKFYWDIGSTNTYFAFHLLRPLATRYNTQIEYIPFNLGYVFRHHNYALTQEPRAKMKNRKDDLNRWAKRYDLPFQVPDEFPIKTSRVLRGALVAREHNLEVPYMEAVFARYWEENDASIATYEGLSTSIVALGLDAEAFIARAESDEMKQQFIDITQTALDEGVFGAPIVVMDDEIYWGKDRFEFVEDHLKRWTNS